MTTLNPTFPADAPACPPLPPGSPGANPPILTADGPTLALDVIQALRAGTVLGPREARHLRTRMATVVELLIGALDALDAPIEDLEDVADTEGPDVDLEPSIGWSDKEAAFNRHLPGDDREEEHDGREFENEHGGDVNDEPHDEDSDREPLLGALESPVALSQLGWADSGNGIEDEAGDGPPPAVIEAARKRYRQGRSNVYIPGAGGGRYDASTGERLPDKVAPVGIAVELQYHGHLTLRGPDGRRADLSKRR